MCVGVSSVVHVTVCSSISRTTPVPTKMASVAPGGVFATAKMSHTKKRMRHFWRPTMIQMKPSATRMAFGPTLLQFQARMVAIWAATTGVSQRRHCSGVAGGSGGASQRRVRTAWFSTLRHAKRRQLGTRTVTRVSALRA